MIGFINVNILIYTRFVPSMEVLLYHGSREERVSLRRKRMPLTVTPSFPVIVTSYEVAMNDRRFLAKYKWKYIVVDEVFSCHISCIFLLEFGRNKQCIIMALGGLTGP